MRGGFCSGTVMTTAGFPAARSGPPYRPRSRRSGLCRRPRAASVAPAGLTRSLADFAKLVELFDARSVSFVSVTQAFNTTTSMGRFMSVSNPPSLVQTSWWSGGDSN